MRVTHTIRLAVLGVVLASGPALAADFSDPTWPCVQRKVEKLSLGIMWPHPVPETAKLDRAGAELAEILSLRRVSMDEVQKIIADFMLAYPRMTVEDLGLVFNAVFERVQRNRTQIIGGIERYSLQQLALSEKIDATRVAMDDLMAADAPDFDQVDLLEEKLDWDERIYRDRALSLTQVCETPVLLEQRIYAIAQALLVRAPG